MTREDIPLAVIGTPIFAGEVWLWIDLFHNARHGHWPVSFLGALTLLGDPIIAIFALGIGVYALFTRWKYRTHD